MSQLNEIGLSDITLAEQRKEFLYKELKDGHTLEEIINYHDSWNWEKFTREGKF